MGPLSVARVILLLGVTTPAPTAHVTPAPTAAPAAAAHTATIALPGTSPIGMDYLAYDAANGRVWVPAGSSGAVDVIDTATRKLTRIGGFPTKPSPRAGRPDAGPSSVTIGDDRVWIGSRADDKLCAVNQRTLERRTCVQLPRMPDGVAYVAATHEVWVTTPSANNLTIVDVSGATPHVTGAIDVGGQPEGYAVDLARGLFYTNLEDQDRTVAVDVKTRAIVARWPTGCGADGPRGLALDGPRRLLFVACASGAVTLDAGHDGRPAGRVRTGGGVDNIDYAPAQRLLYVASARDGTLTFARVADDGALTVVAARPTAAGARNPVVDRDGTAYVADTPRGRLIVLPPPP